MKTVSLDISLIENNTGQITGVKQNPRDLNNDGFEKAVQSIRDFPEMLTARELVVVGHENRYVVIGGNQRLRALKHLGHTNALCKIVEWTTEQINEFIIKDNVEYGTWNFELLATDWDMMELQEWGLTELPEFNLENEDLEEQGLTDEDEVPAVQIIPITKQGDLWIMGEHRLLCGDSTIIDDVEKLMDGEKADMVWTDPPYNIAINAKAGKILNDDMSAQDFATFMNMIYTNYFCVMREGAVIYVAHSEFERATFTSEFVKAGFKFAQNLIWVKHSATFGRQDFNWRHEPILYGWKEGAGHYYCKDFTQTTVIDDSETNNYSELNKNQLIAEIRKLKKHDGSTVIKYDKPHISELHPTMKPVGLVARMIGWSSQDNDIILDLFGGSGTTLIACMKFKRKTRLMELDPKFCDVIVKRWQGYTGKEAILQSTGQTFSQLANSVHNG